MKTTMTDRFLPVFGWKFSAGSLFDRAVMAFAISEARLAVAEALAPRDPSPELAAAEEDVADLASTGPSPACKVVLDELARLRAAVALANTAVQTTPTPSDAIKG